MCWIITEAQNWFLDRIRWHLGTVLDGLGLSRRSWAHADFFVTYLAFGWDRIGPALFCCEQLGMAGHLTFYRFFARSYGG